MKRTFCLVFILLFNFSTVASANFHQSKTYKRLRKNLWQNGLDKDEEIVSDYGMDDSEMIDRFINDSSLLEDRIEQYMPEELSLTLEKLDS